MLNRQGVSPRQLIVSWSIVSLFSLRYCHYPVKHGKCKQPHCRAALSLWGADVMFKLCVSVCFHLLTMTPYLSDLAVRLSGFHHALISAQPTHPFTCTHTYTPTNKPLSLDFPYHLCLYSEVEATFSHLSGQLVQPCDTFKG